MCAQHGSALLELLTVAKCVVCDTSLIMAVNIFLYFRHESGLSSGHKRQKVQYALSAV